MLGSPILGTKDVMVRYFQIVLAIVFAFCVSEVPAHAQNPEDFTIQPVPNGLTGEKHPDGEQGPFNIEKLSIDISICGLKSKTMITATIANSLESEIAGRVLINLPSGATKVSYAFDVDGEMTNDTLVKIGRKDSFRTNVFAFAANGERTVKIGYTAPYGPVAGFAFPLDGFSPSTWITVTVDAQNMSNPPQIAMPNGKMFNLDKEGGRWKAGFSDGLYRVIGNQPIMIKGGKVAGNCR
ncbi:hypothetical protein [Parasphingorhabdus sp.]